MPAITREAPTRRRAGALVGSNRCFLRFRATQARSGCEGYPTRLAKEHFRWPRELWTVAPRQQWFRGRPPDYPNRLGFHRPRARAVRAGPHTASTWLRKSCAPRERSPRWRFDFPSEGGVNLVLRALAFRQMSRPRWRPNVFPREPRMRRTRCAP